jgi:hypothetical protein
MKKALHILVSLLLLMTILFIGNGINIIRCAHSGTVEVVTAIGNSLTHHSEDNCCSIRSKCMTVTHLELSPTVTNQQVDTDFHIFQPLLTILPDFSTEWLLSVVWKPIVQSVYRLWKSPPRDYLNFICILLI